MNYSDSSLRDTEKGSIREFVESCSHYFKGDVLDYGSGKQPYRSIVEAAGAKYIPYDRISHPGSCATTDVGPEHPLFNVENYDAILCTQVLQYIPVPQFLIDQFRVALKFQGALIMTFPTTWPEIENEDLWRYTLKGVQRMMMDFQIERFVARGPIDLDGFNLQLGYGVVSIK